MYIYICGESFTSVFWSLQKRCKSPMSIYQMRKGPLDMKGGSQKMFHQDIERYPHSASGCVTVSSLRGSDVMELMNLIPNDLSAFKGYP